MKVNRIYRQQKIYATIEQVWNYFSTPLNLSVITPEWLNFKIISDVPKEMYEGLIIEYSITPILNIHFKWVTEITHINKPYFFVDEQRFGPYKFWHHKHFFEELDDRTVLMTDEVHYILNFNILNLFVAKKLRAIFDYRYKKVDEIFNKR